MLISKMWTAEIKQIWREICTKCGYMFYMQTFLLITMNYDDKWFQTSSKTETEAMQPR